MKSKLQRLFWDSWRWLKTMFWRREALYALLVAGILIFSVFLLSIVPTNASFEEINTAQQSTNLTSIGQNPLYLPYKTAAFVVLKISDSIRALRAVSILFFGLSVVALYRILKRWHSDKVAFFSAAMYGTNATALAVGRLATPLVLLLSWSLIISLLLWLQHGKSRRVAPFALATSSAALLYIPGAPYFFILLALLFGSKFKIFFKSMTRKSYYYSVGAALLALTPLIIVFIQDINIFKLWLLLPQHIEWGLIPKDILRVPSAFIFRSPDNPLIGIGRLPIFDVASGGLFLLGLYSYRNHLKLDRTKVMILTGLLSVIVGALGQVMLAEVLLLPFVYAIIASGICFILDQWYTVFPKNPLARWFGISLIGLIVISSIYYQLTRFMVVWPNTPQTRAEYNHSRLLQ